MDLSRASYRVATWPYALNNRDEVLFEGENDPLHAQGYVWDNFTVRRQTALLPPAIRSTDSGIDALNDQGQMLTDHYVVLGPRIFVRPTEQDFISAAFSTDGILVGGVPSGRNERAAWWNEGTIHVLDQPPPPAASALLAVNARHDFAGEVSTGPDYLLQEGLAPMVPALWRSDGSFEALTSPHLCSGVPHSINDSDTVVGEGYWSDDCHHESQSHGFVWENGSMEDLGLLPGCTESTALSVNDRDQIVGQDDCPLALSHALMWENHRMIDLNSVLPRNSGWWLTSALAISNSGVIVGAGLTHGEGHGFVLLPPGMSSPTATALPTPRPTSTPFAAPRRFPGGDDSPSVGVNAAHDNSLQNDWLTPPLHRLWVRKLPGAATSPLVVGNRVFVVNRPPTGTNRVYSNVTAFALSTGHTLWSVIADHASGQNDAQAVYAGRCLVVTSGSDLLKCLSPRDGRTRWSHHFGGTPFTGAPVADNTSIYASKSDSLNSYSLADGHAEWSASIGGYGILSSPTLAGGNLYVAAGCGPPWRIDAATGVVTWKPVNGCGAPQNLLSPASDGKLFEPSGDVADLWDPTKVQRVFPKHDGLLMAADGRMTFYVKDRHLYACMNGCSKSAWRFTGDHWLDTYPLVVHGVVYVGSLYNELYAVDERTGRRLWSTDTGASAPPISVTNPGVVDGMAAGRDTLIVVSQGQIAAYRTDGY